MEQGPESRGPGSSRLLFANGADWGGLTLRYFEAADHEVFGPAWRPHPALGVFTHGRAAATIHAGTKRYDIDIGPGVAGVFGPQFDVTRETWHCQGARRLVVPLDLAAYERLGVDDELFSLPLQQDMAAPDPDLFGLMTAMLEEAQGGNPHGRLYAETLGQGLLRYVHHRYGPTPRKTGAARGASLSRAQFARVHDYVQVHLAADISLQQMADAAGVSRAHFVRLFRNGLHQSPHEYLVGERIRHARRLLQQQGAAASLADVSLECGFSTQSHFSTQFRRQMRMTPGAFRALFGDK